MMLHAMLLLLLLAMLLGRAEAVDCGCTGTNTLTVTNAYYTDDHCTTRQTKYEQEEPWGFDSTSTECYADYGCKCSKLAEFFRRTQSKFKGFVCTKANNPNRPEIKSVLTQCYSTVDNDVDGGGPSSSRPGTLALALAALVALVALVPGAEAVDCGCTGTNTLTLTRTFYTDADCSTRQTQYPANDPENHDSTSTNCLAYYECKCSKTEEYLRGTTPGFEKFGCMKVNSFDYPEIKSLLYKCYSTVDGDGKTNDNDDTTGTTTVDTTDTTAGDTTGTTAGDTTVSVTETASYNNNNYCLLYTSPSPRDS